MVSVQDLFNSSSARYADVGFASHWFWIAVAELFGLSGLVLIVTVGLALVRDPRLFKSFATLCAAQSIADVIVVGWITLVVIPLFAIRDPIPPYSIINYLTTNIGCFYMLENFLIAVITIDRYCAICKPTIYQRMFTVKKCQLYVLAGAFYGAGNWLYQANCPWWINTDNYMISWDLNVTANATEPCGFGAAETSSLQAMPLTLTGLVMSLLSVYELRKREKQLDDQQKKAQNLDRKRRALMTCVYNLLYQAAGITVFNFVGPHAVQNGYKILVMYLTKVNWMSQHMFNSFMLLFYQPSIRTMVREMFGVKSGKVGNGANNKTETQTGAQTND